ncbi:hypothetical protein [Clostridium septicum]|uniref:DUF3592 domain-containing protein n=1 Tax=Clostridium septicum TaxID=1504 RepID=A0A9N7JIK4_CLOSE|nr:hypothetical protein [Clostridium septicum]AYE33183.1 hypothetical protein CP523_01275 [Clostridium septicum]MDU1315120.1 hypothetical protein [Clostridium septicum]QAS61353.1 hypothetical protein EI377_11775 [Clostridium septicum]UEC22215.1 hypothetical protein LK444_07605 [Clostridium septicum]USR99756.1 hypothetical protein NH397_09580 [Clostridium septicum]
MATYVFVIIGVLIILVGGITALSKKRLYKYGVKNKGIVVDLDTYTYITPGPDFNTIYHSGIISIIEVEDNNKKFKVAYCKIEENLPLEIGDKVDVIYYKGDIENLEIYKYKGRYVLSMTIASVGVIIIILSSIFHFL